MPPRNVPVHAIAALSGIVVITLLAFAISSGASEPFDSAVIAIVRGDPLAMALSPLRWITELGSTGVVTAIALFILLVGALIGRWLHGLTGALTVGLTSIGNQLLKATVARARPELLEPIVVEPGYSFPSGHAVLSMVAYGVLGVLICRSRLPRVLRSTAISVLAIVIFLVGISRIWLGVHYPTDVIAGWIAGAVIVLVFERLSRSVSPEPAAAAVDADPEAPRSDPPAPG